MNEVTNEALTLPAPRPATDEGAPAATRPRGPPAWRYWVATGPMVSAVNFALTGLGLVLGAVTLPNHGWLWWFMGALCVITFLAWWSAARAAAEAEGQAARLAALHETLGGVAASIHEIRGAHPVLAEALEKVNRLSEPSPPPSPGGSIGARGASPQQQRFENWKLRQQKKEMKQSARAANKTGQGGKKGKK